MSPSEGLPCTFIDSVCVVVGGGTGIALAISKTLADRGARVYFTAHPSDVLDQALPALHLKVRGKLVGLPCDITNKKSIRELSDAIRIKEGRLDVLVNASYADVKNEKAWIGAYQTNVIGTSLVTAGLLPLMSQGASVLNVLPYDKIPLQGHDVQHLSSLLASTLRKPPKLSMLKTIEVGFNMSGEERYASIANQAMIVLTLTGAQDKVCVEREESQIHDC